MRIEQTEAGERDLLGVGQNGLEPPPDVQEGSIWWTGRRATVGARTENFVAGEIKIRLDRGEWGLATGWRVISRCPRGIYLALEQRRQDSALGRQLRFGLSDQLVFIEAKEEQASQWQDRGRGQYRAHDHGQ